MSRPFKLPKVPPGRTLKGLEREFWDKCKIHDGWPVRPWHRVFVAISISAPLSMTFPSPTEPMDHRGRLLDYGEIDMSPQDLVIIRYAIHRTDNLLSSTETPLAGLFLTPSTEILRIPEDNLEVFIQIVEGTPRLKEGFFWFTQMPLYNCRRNHWGNWREWIPPVNFRIHRLSGVYINSHDLLQVIAKAPNL